MRWPRPGYTGAGPLFAGALVQNLPPVCRWRCSCTAQRERMTSLSDIHVLVVDDNAQMRFLLRCLMRAGGIFNVTEAETGGQAFEVMRASQVDLIILDWKMAPIDGLALARMLRLDLD